MQEGLPFRNVVIGTNFAEVSDALTIAACGELRPTVRNRKPPLLSCLCTYNFAPRPKLNLALKPIVTVSYGR